MERFTGCSVMVITGGTHADEVYRLELDADTQKEICRVFDTASDNLVSNKTKVWFDGSYKPHEDEFLSIDGFQLPGEIKEALRDPLGVPSYKKQDGSFMDIKAIFVGKRMEAEGNEMFEAAFQRFRRDQYISTGFINLFFTRDTFRREKDFGISISDSVDCCYMDGELRFSSFHFARQVFNLSGYYRIATDQEVESFSSCERLKFDSQENFRKMADSWVRRKIAMINDSKVLSNYTASEIKALAKKEGIDITVKNKRIVIPDDKERVKVILGFLDEEAYRGPFSKLTFLANSKRRI